MKNAVFILAILILSDLSMSGFAQKQNSSIISTENPKGWIIETSSSTYQIIITTNGGVKPVYYGSKEQSTYQKKNALWSENIDEVPVRGGFPFKTPMFEVIFADHVRDVELRYLSGEVVNINGRQTLKITQKDNFYPLQVISFIRVLPELDILEKWVEIKNTGEKENIKVENLLSGNIVLAPDEYVLTQLSGKELNEFQPIESLLTPGLKVIQNKTFKSNSNAPWFQVRSQSTASEENGPTWFGSLHYSGNWQLVFDKTFNGTLQIVGGINFWDTDMNLKPGEKFITPKLSIGFTQKGSEGVAQRLSAYVRKEILPKENREEMRPVLFNSWYATTDKLNEKQQLELAKIASQLGVELFVIDAGWYKTNNNSWTGMGSWEVDKTKFPNGLSSVIKNVNDLGMKFGIWVEPETVNSTSDIYLEHPDWVLQFPNRNSTNKREILNIAKEEVYQHLLSKLSNLLKDNNIEFVKWDQNNYLMKPGWPDAPAEIQREVRIRYIQNLYRLVDELKKRFPKVLFESCSSGGGRIDLGMMSKMDQAWISDNSTSVDRLFIQYGYLSAMPANTMVSWVIEKIGDQTHQTTSLSYKFDVAMCGVLGLGYDIRKWTPEELELVKGKIDLYKKIRLLIQQGTLYRLVSPFKNNRCALQYNSANGISSVVFCYNMFKYLPGSQLINHEPAMLKLKGLNAELKYLIKKADDKTDDGIIYNGDYLMNVGLAWPIKNAFESQIISINQVE